jgi:hypothetical protein
VSAHVALSQYPPDKSDGFVATDAPALDDARHHLDVSDHVGAEVFGRLRLRRRLGGNGLRWAPAALAIAGRFLLASKLGAVVIAAAFVRLPAAPLGAATERAPHLQPPGVARIREELDPTTRTALQATTGFRIEIQDRVESVGIVFDGSAGGLRLMPVSYRDILLLDFYYVKPIVRRIMRIVVLFMAPSYSSRSTKSSG